MRRITAITYVETMFSVAANTIMANTTTITTARTSKEEHSAAAISYAGTMFSVAANTIMANTTIITTAHQRKNTVSQPYLQQSEYRRKRVFTFTPVSNAHRDFVDRVLHSLQQDNVAQ